MPLQSERPHRTDSQYSLRGDISGGFSAALVLLPGSLAFGTVVFAPLGSSYIATGIAACIFGSIIMGIISIIFGSSKIMISAPRSFTVVTLAALAGLVYNNLYVEMGTNFAAITAVFAVMVASSLSGLIQVLISLLKLGYLVKLLPFQIISGLINLSAILIIISQLPALFGLANFSEMTNLSFWGSETQVFSLIVGGFTILVILQTRRKFASYIAVMMACVTGALLFQLLTYIFPDQKIGETLPSFEVSKNLMIYGSWSDWSSSLPQLLTFWPQIAVAALALALLHSVSTLICDLEISYATDSESHPNQELLANGISNLVIPILFAVPGAGKSAATMTNYKSGGRTRVSIVIAALTYLIILVALSPFLYLMPRAVLAGVAVTLGLGLFDKHAKSLFGMFMSRNFKGLKQNFSTLLVLVTVMFIGVFYDFLHALLAGLVVATCDFLYRTARLSKNHIFTGLECRSRTQRSDKEIQVLEQQGKRICILQIEGLLFFLVADSLSGEIKNRFNAGADYVLLDMSEISYLDKSAVIVLGQLQKKFSEQDKMLLICGIKKSQIQRSDEWQELICLFPRHLVFPDSDRGLEFCENKIIDSSINPQTGKLKLEESTILSGLSSEEIEKISPFFDEINFKKNDVVIQKGASGDALFIIAHGSLDVFSESVRLSDSQATNLRLFTYTQGSLIGEMSLIDGMSRSAEVVSRTDSYCYRLTTTQFQKLQQHHPQLACLILIGIASVISSRLRYANTVNQSLFSGS